VKYGGIAIAVGIVAVAAYLVIRSTSQSTGQTAGACSGDWTDYVNPACWLGGAEASISNAANTATNEINTILIILAVVVVAVVGLLAFGPQTQHIARGAGALAIL
jgi:hypothetical protein